METLKLIPMTDYVLEEHKNYDGIETTQNNFDNIRILALNRIINYTNFLKQPLKLGMFVPCDENDVPLHKPIYSQEEPDRNFDFDERYLKYKQAKERVIFEGFEIDIKESAVYFDSNLGQELFTFRKWSSRFFGNGNELTTIEDLIKYNLTITASAIKKYNL